MDPGPAQAVRTAFKHLYDQGLIYRGERMMNWDPVNQTTVSDLEVIHTEEDGHLWYISYPVEGDPSAVHHRGDHAAGNDARRHRRRGQSRRRALSRS